MNLFFAVIGSLLLNAVPLLAADIFVDADPSPGVQSGLQVAPGSSFTIDVVVTGVDPAKPLDVYEFDLHFDPNVLRAVSVVSGGFLPGAIAVEAYVTSLAVNWTEGVLGLPGVAGDGILARITFEAIGNGTSTLDLREVVLAGVGEDITGAVTPGIVTAGLPDPLDDPTPDAFSFTPQTGVALNTTVTSNTITVSGINTASSIGITGGSFSINGGAFTTVSGTVNNGNTVVVQVTSSGNFSTQTCATLTIGGVQGAFCATTQAAPAPAGFLQFSLSSFSVNENGGSAAITVTRTSGSNGAVGVTFTTSNGTALSGQDYTAMVNQVVSFANGDTVSKTVNIPIINDSTFEGNETVNLALSNPTGGATLGSSNTAVLTILEDDPIPSLSIDNVSLNEGHTGTKQFNFTVTLSNPSS
jgi:Calx-beta domain/Cohesin domain